MGGGVGENKRNGSFIPLKAKFLSCYPGHANLILFKLSNFLFLPSMQHALYTPFPLDTRIGSLLKCTPNCLCPSLPCLQDGHYLRPPFVNLFDPFGLT